MSLCLYIFSSCFHFCLFRMLWAFKSSHQMPDAAWGEISIFTGIISWTLLSYNFLIFCTLPTLAISLLPLSHPFTTQHFWHLITFPTRSFLSFFLCLQIFHAATGNFKKGRRGMPHNSRVGRFDNSFFPYTLKFWKSLPSHVFPNIYDLAHFKTQSFHFLQNS